MRLSKHQHSFGLGITADKIDERWYWEILLGFWSLEFGTLQ